MQITMMGGGGGGWNAAGEKGRKMKVKGKNVTGGKEKGERRKLHQERV